MAPCDNRREASLSSCTPYSTSQSHPLPCCSSSMLLKLGLVCQAHRFKYLAASTAHTWPFRSEPHPAVGTGVGISMVALCGQLRASQAWSTESKLCLRWIPFASFYFCFRRWSWLWLDLHHWGNVCAEVSWVLQVFRPPQVSVSKETQKALSRANH